MLFILVVLFLKKLLSMMVMVCSPSATCELLFDDFYQDQTDVKQDYIP